MNVFPAFNDSYKTRKRTFRCCKKCRLRRIRCNFLTPDYEIHGCDNCRNRGEPCNLARSYRPELDGELPVKAEPALPLPKAKRAKLNMVPMQVETPSLTGTSEPTSQPSQPLLGQFQFQLNPQPPVLAKPLHTLHIASLHALTLSPAPDVVRSKSFSNGPRKDLDSAGLHQDYLYKNLGYPEREVSPGQKTHLSTMLPPLFPMVTAAPYAAAIDNVDAIIHHIDWRYLKQHYDFNTTIRQLRFYFSKTLSRKNTLVEPEVVKDVLARKHISKSMHLGPQNALHFKFLLSMHAFTLNTPGFCEISETDLVKLFEIYFYKVNSVFPIVFESEFWELYKRDRIPSVLMYAVVLTAARDELAEPILECCFADNGTPFKEKHVRFQIELEMKIRQLLIFLPELGDSEKLARLTTQLLLSLNFKFNKFGNEQSSHDISDCVGYAYSLLIHQDFFHARIAQEGAQKKSTYLKHLWWVIFIFDRFNAVLNGKAMFINRRDFNIARPIVMPHLNSLVGLAFLLEDTVIAAFRPPRKNGNLEEQPLLEFQEGDPVFAPIKFIEEELKIIGNTDYLNSVYTEYRKHEARSTGHIPNIPVEKYRDRMVFLLERFVSMNIVLILRTGQVKYLDHSPQLDEFSLQLSDSFLKNFQMLKDGRGHQLVMATPLIPLLMLVAFSIPLTTRLRIINEIKNMSGMDYQKVVKVNELSQAFLQEIESFSDKWWFVHEVVTSIKSMKMAKEFDEPKVRRRHSKNPDNSAANRDRVSVHSLVESPSDVESVLPPMLSITSPGFYDEVIKKEDSDEEEEEEELSKSANHDIVNTKMLVPPMMRSFMTMEPSSIITTDDLAFRAQEVRALVNANAENSIYNQPSGSAGSVSSEDVNFDVGQLAELVNTETSFVPSIMDFFNEQSHELFM